METGNHYIETFWDKPQNYPWLGRNFVLLRLQISSLLLAWGKGSRAQAIAKPITVPRNPYDLLDTIFYLVLASATNQFPDILQRDGQGTKCPSTEEHLIRRYAVSGYSANKIARVTGRSHGAITRILNAVNGPVPSEQSLKSSDFNDWLTGVRCVA